ncbi:hypothetical protein D3C78_1844780 [compost metagenome]
MAQKIGVVATVERSERTPNMTITNKVAVTRLASTATPKRLASAYRSTGMAPDASMVMKSSVFIVYL